VLTLGVDLASSPKTTGLCIIDWANRSATIRELAVNVDDSRILSAARNCDAVGVDAPFGWPIAFTQFLAEQTGNRTPFAWTHEQRNQLQYRETDRYIQSQVGRPPLSVSSDRIAVVAMRCAGLLAQLGVQDRSGEHSVFEVYPAAALKRWGFDFRSYTRREKSVAAGVFQSLVRELSGRVSWLHCAAESYDLLKSDTDAFDALICALVARAAELKLTDQPSEEQATLAKTEGWIHIPSADCLHILAR